MDVKQYELFTKVHNELIKRMGIKADKYERQDSFGAIIDIQNGKDMKETIIKTFKISVCLYFLGNKSPSNEVMVC